VRAEVHSQSAGLAGQQGVHSTQAHATLDVVAVAVDQQEEDGLVAVEPAGRVQGGLLIHAHVEVDPDLLEEFEQVDQLVLCSPVEQVVSVRGEYRHERLPIVQEG